MPVSELGCKAAVNFKAQGERETTHGGDHSKDSTARSIAPLDAYGGSVLLTTIRVPADVIRSNANPAVRVGGKRF